MDKEIVRASVEEANARIAKARNDIKLLEGTVRGLQSMCPHEWDYDGSGYHGSSAGDDYYTCKVCGAKETR